ncbi:MAG TPA: aromatic amino acid ammonia-lyase [Solirubrobacteraceae bacterium]|nr:aromatic amino acid ammonia-lyase [Solirubrobacteraceae bacterium]
MTPIAQPPGAILQPEPVVLDGDTLTPRRVALIAREGALAVLAPQARARNDAARATLAALIESGAELYGVSTGVGALRGHRVAADDRAGSGLALLRSHAGGAGRPLPATLVRAAMAARANQIAAGGAGVSAELLDALVAALNAGLSPFTRELGSLGTGDLTNLADIALCLLGEGAVWRGDELLDAAAALRDAGIAPAVLGPRDGLAFMSSNAVAVGSAALLVVDARRLLDAWLSVAALSFEAAGADPVVLDPRIHSPRHRPGQSAVAARMRELLGGLTDRRRRGPSTDRGEPLSSPAGQMLAALADTVPVQDPYPFRAQPQVDGAVHDALAALEETVGHELNFAGENALVVDGVALPNGNPHAAPLANVIDGLRTALASSAALIAARVSTLLDSGLTGLPPFLTRPGRAGAESGALVLEYTAHAAVAEVRSLVTPVAAQTVSVSRGVESHSSLAPTAVRRAREALDALRVAVACELVVAVRALRLAGLEPRGDRSLWDAAAPLLDPELADRPLAPDVEAARALIEAWAIELP